VNKKVYIMSSESEIFLNQLKESGYQILVDKFSQEITFAKQAAESLTKTMPDSHHMYDEPSNVFTPNKINIDNNE
tara:strand:- start:121 stop:345 length:225 start_codon:yes stop_codon:yes gene_type:complete